MNRRLIYKLFFLLFILLFSGINNALANTYTSEIYSSFQDCDFERKTNNKLYPDFYRSECIQGEGNQNYFYNICETNYCPARDVTSQKNENSSSSNKAQELLDDNILERVNQIGISIEKKFQKMSNDEIDAWSENFIRATDQLSTKTSSLKNKALIDVIQQEIIDTVEKQKNDNNRCSDQYGEGWKEAQYFVESDTMVTWIEGNIKNSLSCEKAKSTESAPTKSKDKETPTNTSPEKVKPNPSEITITREQRAIKGESCREWLERIGVKGKNISAESSNRGNKVNNCAYMFWDHNEYKCVYTSIDFKDKERYNNPNIIPAYPVDRCAGKSGNYEVQTIIDGKKLVMSKETIIELDKSSKGNIGESCNQWLKRIGKDGNDIQTQIDYKNEIHIDSEIKNECAYMSNKFGDFTCTIDHINYKSPSVYPVESCSNDSYTATTIVNATKNYRENKKKKEFEITSSSITLSSNPHNRISYRGTPNQEIGSRNIYLRIYNDTEYKETNLNMYQGKESYQGNIIFNLGGYSSVFRPEDKMIVFNNKDYIFEIYDADNKKVIEQYEFKTLPSGKNSDGGKYVGGHQSYLTKTIEKNNPIKQIYDPNKHKEKEQVVHLDGKLINGDIIELKRKIDKRLDTSRCYIKINGKKTSFDLKYTGSTGIPLPSYKSSRNYFIYCYNNGLENVIDRYSIYLRYPQVKGTQKFLTTRDKTITSGEQVQLSWMARHANTPVLIDINGYNSIGGKSSVLLDKYKYRETNISREIDFNYSGNVNVEPKQSTTYALVMRPNGGNSLEIYYVDVEVDGKKVVRDEKKINNIPQIYQDIYLKGKDEIYKNTYFTGNCYPTQNESSTNINAKCEGELSDDKLNDYNQSGYSFKGESCFEWMKRIGKEGANYSALTNDGKTAQNKCAYMVYMGDYSNDNNGYTCQTQDIHYKEKSSIHLAYPVTSCESKGYTSKTLVDKKEMDLNNISTDPTQAILGEACSQWLKRNGKNYSYKSISAQLDYKNKATESKNIESRCAYMVWQENKYTCTTAGLGYTDKFSPDYPSYPVTSCSNGSYTATTQIDEENLNFSEIELEMQNEINRLSNIAYKDKIIFYNRVTLSWNVGKNQNCKLINKSTGGEYDFGKKYDLVGSISPNGKILTTHGSFDFHIAEDSPIEIQCDKRSKTLDVEIYGLNGGTDYESYKKALINITGSIENGNILNLQWSIPSYFNIETCKSTGFNVNNFDNKGDVKLLLSDTKTTKYKIECEDPKSLSGEKISKEVYYSPPERSQSLEVNNLSIKKGDLVELKWEYKLGNNAMIIDINENKLRIQERVMGWDRLYQKQVHYSYLHERRFNFVHPFKGEFSNINRGLLILEPQKSTTYMLITDLESGEIKTSFVDVIVDGQEITRNNELIEKEIRKYSEEYKKENLPLYKDVQNP